ncbi:sugar-binding domain-containing protein [Marinoscillum sp. MHG1-6]|uniref:sugar-binding domain-containing protein n=1 Tax=Marinoscillum sp. MHG1-6 TaxID=2959627 RepID=UPI0021575585|nr:sugar-binding domain-containing protein [Marinoscillum sp. MHG1-6]
MRRPLLILFFIIGCAINCATFGQGFGMSELLTDWYFHLGDVRLGGRETLDHSAWQKVMVPHDWSVKQNPSPDLASCTGYLPGGIGWYRTNINVPENVGNDRRYLYFEGVYNNSEVFINGKWLGKRPNGYVSFSYDITPYLKPGQVNVIAVKVDHSQDADSRWYTGSGIYRNVHLISASDVHLDQWGVYYRAQIKKGQADLQISTRVANHKKQSVEAKIIQTLLDEGGAIIARIQEKLTVPSGEKSTVKQVLNLSKPHLWGIDDPYLYVLQTQVLLNGKVSDETTTTVGIRDLKFDPDKGFALNGEWMKIKGVCLHHDAGVLGAAVPKEVWRARVLRLKEIGVNGIRMSHNPQSTDLYEICDELGMLVMDEAFDEWEYPKKKWIKGWNVGEPGFQGAAEYFREWSKKDLSDMVYRDRNHPSIIMWSIGNEVDYPNDPYSHPILDKEGIGQIHVSGYRESQPRAERLGDIAKELAAVVREIDSSRPVTAALAGAVMSNETEYPSALDIVGYNYTESRYEMDHQEYPDRVLYGSETRHDMNAWKSVRDNEFIFGQFIWTGFDYLGEAGRWPSRGFTTGMIDQANHMKGRGYFRKSLWSDEPTIYVGTYRAPRRNWVSMDAPHTWSYEEGELIRVVCYTNGEEAELQLNGEIVGKRKPYDDESGIIYWDIPFQPGELKACAYRDGEPISEDVIVTEGNPYQIVATTEKLEYSKDEWAIIEIEVQDENGNLCTRADNMIECRLKGAAIFMGMENASSNVTEDFNDNELRCKNGKLIAYVKAAEKGDITIEFCSPYIQDAVINLSVDQDLSQASLEK